MVTDLLVKDHKNRYRGSLQRQYQYNEMEIKKRQRFPKNNLVVIE